MTHNVYDLSLEWGAGIGKSISKKLAGQGLNVVLVALQDQLLDDTTEELCALYPELSFRKVGPPPPGPAGCCRWAALLGPQSVQGAVRPKP